MSSTGPGIDSDVLHMKNLEKKFDTLNSIVGEIYKRHDALLEDISTYINKDEAKRHLDVYSHI